MAAIASVTLVTVHNRSIPGLVMPVAQSEPVAAPERFNALTSSQATTAVAENATQFWEIVVTDTVAIAFGANPTANATNDRLITAGKHYFSANSGDKVALIDAAAS